MCYGLVESLVCATCIIPHAKEVKSGSTYVKQYSCVDRSSLSRVLRSAVENQNKKGGLAFMPFIIPLAKSKDGMSQQSIISTSRCQS